MGNFSLTLHNVNVVDVDEGVIRGQQTVLVQDGKIDAVVDSRPAGEIDDREASSFDAAGLYLCPGLIDCHVHFFLDGGPSPRVSFIDADDATKLDWARRNARVAIEAGITTMRDCASPAELMFPFQRQVERGEIPAPHIICCGHALMRPGGHCHFLGGEVSSVEEVYQGIERNLEQGAGFVKLMASGGGLTPGTVPHEADFPIEWMRAATEAAHANGVQITAHCHATESIERAIEVGLDMIEHANFVEPPGRYRYDEPIARRIGERGIVVSPTVYCGLKTAAKFRQLGKSHNPHDTAAVERLEGRLINTGHFHRLGLKIIGGTDCGATDCPFNILVDEMISYTQAGLSRSEALRTVTSEGARLLNLSAVGQIKPGYRADLLLLKRNPLDDLEALRNPSKVFKAGRLVFER